MSSTTTYSSLEVEVDVVTSNPPNTSKRGWVWYSSFFCLFSIMGLVVGLGALLTLNMDKPIDAIALNTYESALRTEKIMAHLNNLQSIAENHPSGSRSVEYAYNASADYVFETLRKQTKYHISKQYFQVPLWTQLGVPSLSIYTPQQTWLQMQEGVDFRQMSYAGNGNLSFDSLTIYMAQANETGCGDEDFGTVRNISDLDVVVVVSEQAGCETYKRALRAQEVGAVALIVTKKAKTKGLPGGAARKYDWTVKDPLVAIGVFAGTATLYQLLASAAAADHSLLRLEYQVKMELVTTLNIYADTIAGDHSQLVVLGAHLDSVRAGPGVNDNGSGSAMLLELALQFERHILAPVRQVRFAWWGAEEIGLLGSWAYMASLSLQERNRIWAYLNFDMVGSGNGIVNVYNANQTREGVSDHAKARSMELTEAFLNNFQRLRHPAKLRDMVGGSDFVPFITNNITAGGLATGAGGLKTDEEKKLFGGLSNAAYDPCYHKSCDTSLNLNPALLLTMARAGAGVVHRLAVDPAFPSAPRVPAQPVDSPQITTDPDSAIE